MLKLTPEDFGIVAKTVYEATGIHLDSTKTYLIETRLSSLVQELGFTSYRQLAELVSREPSSHAMVRLIDAITTNETFFFRDIQPFELLRHKLLPDLYDQRVKRKAATGIDPGPIRIWSAASSTGQEVYSIAMILKEMLPALGNPQVRLLGTDISQAAIQQASAGRYNRFEVERGLAPELRSRYFVAEPNGWRVRDELRALASFQHINLLKSFAGLGKWDIIFCRNVAIYFPMDDRKSLFTRLADALNPGGALLIGSTEFLSGITDRFVSNNHLKSVYYTLAPGK